MNFFANQDQAHRNTFRLVVYFFLAVLLIVLFVNALIVGLYFSQQKTYLAENFIQFLLHPTTVHLILIISGVTLGAILLGSLWQYIQLLGGGESVAEMMGARRIDLGTKDPDEKRLINVVEEMSIASGTPVPTLYVLDDESSINAFVAGYKPSKTVMVVTQGALAQFDREELQGVVGHEYSHIYNGDMRINLRLMAILAGILFLTQLGHFLVYARSDSRRDNGQIALIGIGLIVIGYIGFFFGRLIKAAVARQREYLADASSVQFTRNPLGIACALEKIKQHSSTLNNAHAEDVSHFCFGSSVGGAFFNGLATHPPVERRIKRLDPRNEVPDYIAQKKKRRQREAPAKEKATGQQGIGSIEFVATMAAASVLSSAVQEGQRSLSSLNLHKSTESIGAPTDSHFAFAAKVVGQLPDALRGQWHDEQQAKNIVYAYMLQDSKQPEKVMQQLTQLDPGCKTGLAKIQDALKTIEPSVRLPLIELAIPTLKKQKDKALFVKNIETLIRADDTFTLFELVLLTLLENHLLEEDKKDQIKYRHLKAVIDDVAYLVAYVTLASLSNKETQRQSFQATMQLFKVPSKMTYDAFRPSITQLRRTLKKLAQTSYALRGQIINALITTIHRDQQVTQPEAELLRAIAEALDCPLLPIYP